MSPWLHGSYTSLATRARAHPCKGRFEFPNRNGAVAQNECDVDPANEDIASSACIDFSLSTHLCR